LIRQQACEIPRCVELIRGRLGEQVYSTVKDLAKLVSVFLVGRDERKNALGLYSSTLREMLTPAFMNDDQVHHRGAALVRALELTVDLI
jgi:hypothetical protein